jgi:2-iminobutanoate/2-iminopropanoate deaminase
MQGQRREHTVPGMSEPISHFCHVVTVGRLVFLSGCIASDEHGKIVGGADAGAQARQVHENMKKLLTTVGATFGDICKVTVFVKNMDDREKINTVRKEYFGASRPASTLVEVSRFTREGALVEIEAMAVLPER